MAEDLENVAKCVKNFTVDFHKRIAEKRDGNFVSSALSAHTVLSMTASGAEGTTKDEMRQSLYLPENEQLVQRGFQALIDIFNTVQGVVLKVANKIYASNDVEIKEKFKEITRIYFRSESDTLDFAKNVESANMINKWCDLQTNGQIKEIIKHDMINETTKMVLLNAVYFKGGWKHKFDESLTENTPFHLTKNTTIEVPTMYIKEDFFYKELKELDAEVIGLPYQNEDFYMLIIVPKEIDGLHKLEENFEKFNLDFELVKRRQKIEILLPKFKVETTVDLKAHLTELGMAEMFTDEANFKGISNELLKVDKVIQKAFIEVNEEGTEAAAVTMATMVLCAAFSLSPMVVVDRPFMFKIVHKNCTLFSGRIVNPLES